VGTKDYFGFDEVVVWQQFALHLSKSKNKRLTVVVNMHPNQNNKYLISNLGKYDFQVIVENRIHTNTLLYFSDIVIGMFSSILIEAMIMKKRVIRYMVGFNKEDPFASRVVGEVAYNYKELEQIFSTI
jgi:CDP-glycerol glycerophosphotransferase (TagB/SpsB family)